MKFSKTLAAFAVGAVVTMLAPSAPVQAAEYKIDTAHSFIHFKVMRLGFSYVHADFKKFSGAFEYDAKAQSGGKLNVTVDTASVDSNHAKRNKHLRSPDFFNAAEFPAMTFVSTSATKGKITGNLTLLGQTHPVTLNVSLNKAGIHPADRKKPADKQRIMVGFSATGTLERSKFGMKYGVPFLGDKVTITIEALGVKQ